MTSSDFDAVFRNILYDDHVLFAFSALLQNQIAAIDRPFDFQEFVHSIFHNVFGEFCLADFALELVEVVADGASNNFLFDFAFDPPSETLQVDKLTTANASAGSHQEIGGALRLLHADLTERPWLGLLHVLELGSVLEEGIDVAFAVFNLSMGIHFDDGVRYASQPDLLSNLQAVTLIGAVIILEAPDDYV